MKEVRGQIDQELKSHQITKDQLATKEASIVDLRQEVCIEAIRYKTAYKGANGETVVLKMIIDFFFKYQTFGLCNGE